MQKMIDLSCKSYSILEALLPNKSKTTHVFGLLTLDVLLPVYEAHGGELLQLAGEPLLWRLVGVTRPHLAQHLGHEGREHRVIGVHASQTWKQYFFLEHAHISTLELSSVNRPLIKCQDGAFAI